MDNYDKLVKNDAQFNSFVKSYFQNNQSNIEDISNFKTFCLNNHIF